MSQPRPAALPARSRTRPRAGAVTAALIWLVLVGNAVAIVWLWYHGGNVTRVHSTGEFLTSIARITGLLGAYLALVQVLLLSRLPALERLTGFDRLTVWHRWNGHACLYLILAHVFFSVWGYAQMDRIGIGKETSTMIWGGVYPGMIVATISTALFLAVVATSIVIVRRRLNYQAWYAVHFTTYAAIALGWFHQVPTGNELVLDNVAADYWASLYLATLGLLIVFRLLVPIANAFRYRMRVAEVVDRRPRRRLAAHHRPPPRPPERAARASSSSGASSRAAAGGKRTRSRSPAAPDGHSLRITVKSLGDFTSRIRELAPGTRVVAEGPFGTFTTASRRREKALLVAGGIGITPVRALLEEQGGDAIVLYRVVSESDVDLPRGARVARGRARDRAAHPRRRPHDRRRPRPALARPPAPARARRRRARGLRLRAARDGLRDREATSAAQASRAATSMSNDSPSDPEGEPMRKTLTALIAAAALAIPTANAAAVTNAAAKKKVVTKKVTGVAAQADRWGTVTVNVTVKTTTTVGGKTTRRYIDLGGSYTYHTDRSQYIMSQSLPYLRQEFLSAQSANVQIISGATYTSQAFEQSLQSALAKV